MLEIGIQLFVRKIGEKFRLGASVNFTDAIDQFPFTHLQHPSKLISGSPNLSSIDRLNFFSLADPPTAELTPYNIRHYIPAPAGLRAQHIARPNDPLALVISMSNKIAITGSQSKQKKT
jgi:hypothetical protein